MYKDCHSSNCRYSFRSLSMFKIFWCLSWREQNEISQILHVHTSPPKMDNDHQKHNSFANPSKPLFPLHASSSLPQCCIICAHCRVSSVIISETRSFHLVASFTQVDMCHLNEWVFRALCQAGSYQTTLIDSFNESNLCFIKCRFFTTPTNKPRCRT